MLARDHKIRVFIVFSVFLILFVIIAIRLFLLQIRQKNFFTVMAKQQYELDITINPPRAIIYDRSGNTPLAFNHEVPSAFLLPQQFNDENKIKKFLKKNYPEVLKRINENDDRHFLWLDRKVSPERYLSLMRTGLQDIQFIPEFQRFYPAHASAQLVGFTNIDNAGTAGLELIFSQQLAGKPATIKLEKDARSGSFYFGKNIEKKGKRGSSITLTIDNTLQAIAFDKLTHTINGLQAKGGSVIIIDPNTGQIHAMTNYPTFDPNQKSVPTLEAMKNGISSECYELGSVMKACCALAALEDKVVQLDEIIDCEGRYAYLDGLKIENPTITLLNYLAEHNNKITFHDVVRHSSNVGIAKVAKRLGPRLYTHLRRLGFGSKTNIEFPGERSGFVNPPENWSRPSLYVMSFGYEIMATLLQLAHAFCIIANGGYEVQPTLLKTENSEQPRLGKKLYSDRALDQLKIILEHVCQKHQKPGFRIMGKTGTARCVENGHYSNKLHNYTLAGIIEGPNNYRRVVVTFVKEPQKAGLWASETALPLFSDVAEHMLVLEKLKNNTFSA